MKLSPFFLLGCLASTAIVHAQPKSEAAANAGWTRTRIDDKFRSEGAAVADVNRDGKQDILVGDFWYQAPNWERREIRTPSELGDGAEGYSKAFCVWADDVNGDGWSDQIVVGFPGEASLWYENPQGRVAGDGHWKERVISPSACNETPQFVDLLGDGKKRLVFGVQPEGQIVWLSPNADIEKPWDRHPISEASTPEKRTFGTDRFDHGLGVGDVNKDGRADVLVRQGWWEQPIDARNRTTDWTFHAANLGEECADLYVVDVDGDGLNDVLSSSAHRRGVWWHRQAPQMPAGWQRQTIDDSFTQSHAMHFVDLDGDGQRELVTGKRFWAHGPNGDEAPGEPPVVVSIAVGRDEKQAPHFAKQIIDDQTGIGTQFSIADVNGDGKSDIVVSNKKGVTLLTQNGAQKK